MYTDDSPKPPTFKSRDPRALNAYRKHCDGIHESLAPVGALETDLAQSVAEDRWRLKRAAALEDGIFGLGMAAPLGVNVNADNPEIDVAFAQARTWLSEGKNLQLLSLYEHRLTRHVEKNMDLILRLQAARAAALRQAVEEAELLTQLAESEGKTYDIEADFTPETGHRNFVFSKPLIARLVARNRRLAQAMEAKMQPPAPKTKPQRAA